MAADSPNDKRQALEALKAENAWLREALQAIVAEGNSND